MSSDDLPERSPNTQDDLNDVSEISTPRPCLSNVNSDTESQPEGIKIYIPADVVGSRQLKIILESSLPGMYSVQLKSDLFNITVRNLPKPGYIGDSPWPPSSASEAILETRELRAFLRKIEMAYTHVS
ncbi:hypothetical protein F4774DRAFT_412285 [Daldinia eschscholtzii]|nr:hypothetical protein F4774DRAFT_412285 [Daldinia eschscholtzii]